MLRTVLVILCIFAVVFAEENDPYGVTMIRSDLDQLLAKTHKATVLFHSSSCPHSNSYKQFFLMAAIKYKQLYSDNSLAVVDCDEDKKICNQYKISLFPSVYEIEKGSQTTSKRIDEQEFLSRAGIVVDKLLEVENVGRWLQEQPHYFVAILQQQGFQAEEKLKLDNVIYLSKDELYNALLGYTRGRVGCWIFQYSISDSSLKKYPCGSGMNPSQIQDKINSFKKGQLQQFVFNREDQKPQFKNQKRINSKQLSNLYNQQALKTKIILYDSQDCWYCRGVASAVSSSLSRLPQKFTFYRFMSDVNQIPQQKTIMKLPFLQLWINNKLHVFQGRFFEETLLNFFKSKITYQPLVINQQL